MEHEKKISQDLKDLKIQKDAADLEIKRIFFTREKYLAMED